MHEDLELIREHARKIERSGALGRSRSYARLLQFLVDCSVNGRTPKELEIAIEVFGKGPNFDPSQDSMVRVYAHNLRQKLGHYYATDGRAEDRQLCLARGEYRVSLVAAENKADEQQPTPVSPGPESVAASATNAVEGDSVSPIARPAPARPALHRARLALVAAALVAVGIAIGIAGEHLRRPPPTPAQVVAATPIWSAVLDDDKPVLVVVGDYYIFGELDEHGDIDRLVRDFAVNSRKELDDLMMSQPSLVGHYMDLDLTYLPRASATALVDVLRVLYTAGKPVRIVSMSELNMADLKTNHVVYLGLLSALGKLEDFVFSASQLVVGYTYDELRNIDTGETYTSEAAIPDEAHGSYRDYGFFSTFPGPNGNQFVIIAGTRDAGMMQAAHAVSDPASVKLVQDAQPAGERGQKPAFELLYEVMGSGRTNFDAMLVHAAPLNYQQIWGGNFLHAEVQP
jgi:hypothetical protein